MSWLNDGLLKKFGVEKTVVNKAGEYVTTGAIREIEVNIDLTALTTTDAIMSDTTWIPANVRIQDVQVITKTVATTGTSAALNVGLIRNDRTTMVDADGFVEALAVTAMDAAGETTTLSAPVSGTSVGNLIGTTIANTGYITAATSTGTFTAGEAIVKIRYYRP